MIGWRRLMVCCMAVGLLVPVATGCRREKPKSVYEIQDETRRQLDEQRERWQQEWEASRSGDEAPAGTAGGAEGTEKRQFDEAQVLGNVHEARSEWLEEGPMDNPGPDEEGFDEDESEEPEPEGKQSGVE